VESFVAWYVGCPKSGKTYLALKHAREQAARTGYGVLLVDSQGEARNFGGVERVAGVDDALIALHGRQAREVKWTPETFEQVEALARALRAVGKLHVVVDESAFWINSQRGRDSHLVRLLRAHGHVPITLHLTTQHYSADVPQEARSCAPVLYVFRCTGQATLNVLEREHRLDPRQVETLPARQFLTVRTGF
jgi:KaiC/GvpD/RAD55 family RecA-like ATPase